MEYSEKRNEKFQNFLLNVLNTLHYRNEMLHFDNTGEILTIETDGSTMLFLRSWDNKDNKLTEAEVLIDETDNFIVTDANKKLSIVSTATQAAQLAFLGTKG